MAWRGRGAACGRTKSVGGKGGAREGPFQPVYGVCTANLVALQVKYNVPSVGRADRFRESHSPMFCPSPVPGGQTENAFSQPFDPLAVRDFTPSLPLPFSLLPFLADQIKLTQSLRACRVRLTALLSGGAVLEAEEAGLAVVVSVALLPLLLAVDREAGPESCRRRGGIVIVFGASTLYKLSSRSIPPN